jgi:transposase InsO family protein
VTEDEKKQVAVFRYGIINEFVGGRRLDHGEQEQLLGEKCAHRWCIPFSGKSRISRSTLLRWVRIYSGSNNKLESLYPKDRNDNGQARALDEDTCLALSDLRRQMPKLTVVELIKLMHQRDLVTAGTFLCSSTVYRFLHSNNLMAKEQGAPTDRRKFESELPNDMWQSDVMHGPHVTSGGKQHKCYLIAFIDDHSRLIPHGQFYLSEAVIPFMNAFAAAVSKRGLPRKLYVDNGSAFRSRQLEYTTAALGIALIHAKPYQPQGKGKIERFFKTVRTQFLPAFSGATLEQINSAFDVWLGEYHSREHSSTKQSPFRRFTSKMECLRSAPDNLRDYFRKTVRRRVNKDRTVVVDCRLYEAPVELIGKRVEILYFEESPEQVEIRCGTTSYGLLRQVDLHVNSRVKRDKNSQIELVSENSAASKPHETTDNSSGISGQLWEDA